ncbi:hypothetical protein GI582_26455, partial [Sulfitobacter sp. BDSS02]|nr:hypothetical protein [Sulfitobacter sp. BDSS02]
MESQADTFVDATNNDEDEELMQLLPKEEKQQDISDQKNAEGLILKQTVKRKRYGKETNNSFPTYSEIFLKV